MIIFSCILTYFHDSANSYGFDDEIDYSAIYSMPFSNDSHQPKQFLKTAQTDSEPNIDADEMV